MRVSPFHFRVARELHSIEDLQTAFRTRLEEARDALQDRGRGAKLLLFGTEFTPGVRRAAEQRADLELVDLPRLYEGA